MVKKEYYENEGFGLARDRLIAFKSGQNRIKCARLLKPKPSFP